MLVGIIRLISKYNYQYKLPDEDDFSLWDSENIYYQIPIFWS